MDNFRATARILRELEQEKQIGSVPIRNERLRRRAHALVIHKRIAHVIAAK